MIVLKYFVYLNRIKLRKKITKQKNRIKSTKDYDITRFFDNTTRVKKTCYIITKDVINLELYHMKLFIKKLRKLNKKKRFRTYIRFCANRVYSKKSTNSRMGKGKGKFVRFFYSCKRQKPLAILRRFSKVRSARFFKILKHSVGNNFMILRNF